MLHYMQMADDLLHQSYGVSKEKRTPSCHSGDTIVRENAVPRTTVHHWSLIVADIKDHAGLGGKQMDLQGTPSEVRVFSDSGSTLSPVELS